jgi:hypothetical protein
MFVSISLSSYLTLLVHILNYLRLPLSFLSHLTYSFKYLIQSSFSLFWWTRFLMFYFVTNVKLMSVDVIESGYFLTFSVTRDSVTIDKGEILVIMRFLVYRSTIFPMSLSNHNFFKYSTLLGLDGV